jgi:hypothetical protein
LIEVFLLNKRTNGGLVIIYSVDVSAIVKAFAKARA